jgi:hypothetical protein
MGESMTNHNVNQSYNPVSRGPLVPAVIAFGLWLPIGYIGASGFAIGLIQLFDGGVKPLSALALAAGGGLLAVFSWRRAQSVLDVANGANTVVKLRSRSPASARAAVGA